MLSSAVPFARAGTLTAEQVRVRCALTTAVELEVARVQLAARRRLQWRIGAFVSCLVTLALALMATPTIWLLSNAAGKGLAVYRQPDPWSRGQCRPGAPTWFSFLLPQQTAAHSRHECPVREPMSLSCGPGLSALGVPGDRRARLTFSAASDLHDGTAQLSQGEETEREGGATAVGPLQASDGAGADGEVLEMAPAVAEGRPGHHSPDHEPEDAIGDDSDRAVGPASERAWAGGTVGWTVLAAAVAALAALGIYLRSKARAKAAPAEIDQVLQLREEVMRSQQELQARERRIESTHATLDMLQKQMVLTDEQRAATAAENAQLKAALVRQESAEVAPGKAPPLRVPLCDLSRGCRSHSGSLPTPRPFQTAPPAAGVMATPGSQLVSLREATFDAASSRTGGICDPRRAAAASTPPPVAAAAGRAARSPAAKLTAGLLQQHDDPETTPLCERSLNVVEAWDTESPLPVGTPPAAQAPAQPNRCGRAPESSGCTASEPQ